MPRRSGFTLIEVMVAIVVSGIVLLGARAMLEATADQARRIVAASSAADHQANAEHVLRALVGRLEVGTAPGAEFAGAPTMTEFASWCEVAGGWEERCVVTLSIEPQGRTSALVVTTSLGDTLRLRSGFEHGTISYLSSAAAGGTWIRIWGQGITAPVALGIFLDRDTLIVHIGERG